LELITLSIAFAICSGSLFRASIQWSKWKHLIKDFTRSWRWQKLIHPYTLGKNQQQPWCLWLSWNPYQQNTETCTEQSFWQAHCY